MGNGVQQASSYSHQPIDDTKKQKRGKGVFGYRSISLQLADPSRRFSLILLDAVGAATACEGHHTAALLRLLPDLYPSLHVDAIAGDAYRSAEQSSIIEIELPSVE